MGNEYRSKVRTHEGLRTVARKMPEIANGRVSFDTVAREWRCKYTGPADTSASLEACQSLLAKHLPTIKAVGGVKEVNRMVCGGCLDFKVSTSVDAASFGEWEKAGFAPEADFIASLKEIEGISCVETQTMTFMKM